jgi:uncharacterized protein (UPF0335 family)
MSNVAGITAGQLKQYIEKIERLEEEKAGIAADIREVFAEAKGNGYDPKIMRQVLKLRKMDRDEAEELEEMVTLYCQALGMLPGSAAPVDQLAAGKQARRQREQERMQDDLVDDIA